jgi:hypothetical protein
MGALYNYMLMYRQYLRRGCDTFVTGSPGLGAGVRDSLPGATKCDEVPKCSQPIQRPQRLQV